LREFPALVSGVRRWRAPLAKASGFAHQVQANFDEWSAEAFPETASEHRGVELYLRPVWAPITEMMYSQETLPEFADTCRAEVDLVDVGEEVVMSMWEKLGLSVEVHADRTSAIWVTAPER
jgi:hypothetical protein